ncbi:MAG: hypothetical protein HY520_04560 [Candidatus Aenigmarchaeota archaeon]|nr:hypothetical protein [Candidatus Aenigmarchaeota archaeon]
MPELYDPTKPFNALIRTLIRETHPRDGPLRVLPLGKRFRVELDRDFVEAYDELPAVDGIGTKGCLHWQMDTVEAGVQDAVAMVFDDLIEHGYQPQRVIDHIMVQEEDQPRLFRMVAKLVKLCTDNPWEYAGGRYPAAVVAGETAIINTLQGFEMGISATGVAPRGSALPGKAVPGDVIIGLGSSGIHSNGLSFYRKALFEERDMTIESDLPWGRTVGDELTIPTTLYLPALRELLASERPYVHGMVHITGGGMTKLMEMVPGKNVNIAIRRDHSLRPQPIFSYAYELGQTDDAMMLRFNNGVGYAIAIARERAPPALATLRAYHPADVIGDVTGNPGRGHVLIESPYSTATVLCTRVHENGRERLVTERF